MPRERLQAHGSHLQARALRWALRSLARDGKSRAGDVPPESVSPRNDHRDRAQAGGAAEGGHIMTATKETPMTASSPGLICPRCQREAVGWPLKRSDRCSPKTWAMCIREPAVIAAERAAR